MKLNLLIVVGMDYDLEKDVHERLNEYRLSSQREFFQVDLEEAKEIIEEIGEAYV